MTEEPEKKEEQTEKAAESVEENAEAVEEKAKVVEEKAESVEEKAVEEGKEAEEKAAEEKTEEAEEKTEEAEEKAEEKAAEEEKEEAPKKPRKKPKKPEIEQKPEEAGGPKIYALRTTANREEQVADFLAANAEKKRLDIYSVLRPHGMRSYIFIEAVNRMEAEQAAFDVPYARGVLPEPVPYEEIEHMVEQVKKEVNIQKNDIVEIISGPFKREQAKVTKVDKDKEEVVVELLEAAVPIPITLKLDALKVIRREE
jgi:transcriptional antiterminator NusG